MTALVVGAVLSLLIGVTLGMLGGGGAILTLPMLLYVLHVEPKAAIAITLFVVGATSVFGAVAHARAGAVRWKTSAIFALAAMPAAFMGGRIGRVVPSTALLVLFSITMLVAAGAMLRGRPSPAEARQASLPKSILLGAGVGALSGLVGAGGGFLVVPALTLFGGVAIREAIGSSLVVIALQSFAGFAGQVGHVDLDWTLLGVIAATSANDSLLGASLAAKVQPAALRRGFGWLVIVTGLFMLAKQLA